MCRHIFVVGSVNVYLSSKMSSEDCEDFKNDFGYEIHLEGASFDENGLKSEFKYYAHHKKLDEFSDQIKEWLTKHSFPTKFFMIKRDLSLYTYDKLSDEQIHDFEKDFNVKCKGYSISCNSEEVKYEFS